MTTQWTNEYFTISPTVLYFWGMSCPKPIGSLFRLFVSSSPRSQSLLIFSATKHPHFFLCPFSWKSTANDPEKALPFFGRNEDKMWVTDSLKKQSFFQNLLKNLYPSLSPLCFMQVSVWFPRKSQGKGRERRCKFTLCVSTHFPSLNANFVFIVGSFIPSNNF